MPPSTPPSRHEFNRLEKEVDGLKGVAISAREVALSPHECKQEEVIREMRTRINTWDKWWKGVMIAVISGVIAAVAFAWKIDDRAAAVENSVDKIDNKVETVSEKVEVISVNQNDIQATLKRQEAEDDVDDQEREKRMRRVMIDVMREIDTPKRRRRVE